MKLVDPALGIVRMGVTDEDVVREARNVSHRNLFLDDRQYTTSMLI
jgi:hypothetical protein